MICYNVAGVLNPESENAEMGDLFASIISIFFLINIRKVIWVEVRQQNMCIANSLSNE